MNKNGWMLIIRTQCEMAINIISKGIAWTLHNTSNDHNKLLTHFLLTSTLICIFSWAHVQMMSFNSTHPPTLPCIVMCLRKNALLWLTGSCLKIHSPSFRCFHIKEIWIVSSVKTVLMLLNMSHTKQCCFLWISNRLGKNNTLYFPFFLSVTQVQRSTSKALYQYVTQQVNTTHMIPHFQESIQTITMQITETLHWNLSKNIFKLWGRKNTDRLHLQGYALLVHHFVSSTHQLFIHHHTLQSRKHLFMACPAHYEHWLSMQSVPSAPCSKYYNYNNYWVGPLPLIYA